MEGPHPDMDEGLSSLCFGSAGGVRAASNAGLARLNTLFALDESRFLCCLRFFFGSPCQKAVPLHFVFQLSAGSVDVAAA